MTANTMVLPSFYYRNYEIPGFRQYFQQQVQTNWCWIATAVSVANFYNNNTLRQCDLYNRCVSLQYRQGNNACLYNARTLPGDHPCNRTGYPDVSMDHADIYVRHGSAGYYGYDSDDIINLVDRNQPPIIGLNFNATPLRPESYQHVVVVFGYTADGRWLIADPLKTKVLTYSRDQLQNIGITLSEIFVSGRG